MYVVYEDFTGYSMTVEENYNARVLNAFTIVKFDKQFKDKNDIINYCEEYLNIQEHELIFKF